VNAIKPVTGAARPFPGAGEPPVAELREPVAELRDVVKTYDERGVAVTAVSGVSLRISRQTFTMIVGASGSGKTTLLNLIGCIDRPTRGEVEVCGVRVGGLSDDALTDFRAAHIGFIFQGFNLFPVLSAYENVEYPLLLLGLPARERRERTMDALDAVGLADQKHRRPNQLSGGQKQRVAIARALVKSPALVLADEPAANLDSATGDAVIALMERMQRERGVSFLFSTHDPQLMSHAQETFVVKDGRLIDHRVEKAA
jgi:putative ABC transport system ATP-binding protein